MASLNGLDALYAGILFIIILAALLTHDRKKRNKGRGYDHFGAPSATTLVDEQGFHVGRLAYPARKEDQMLGNWRISEAVWVRQALMNPTVINGLKTIGLNAAYRGGAERNTAPLLSIAFRAQVLDEMEKRYPNAVKEATKVVLNRPNTYAQGDLTPRLGSVDSRHQSPVGVRRVDDPTGATKVPVDGD